ncbi:MAG: homoserine kinase [Candidatus Izimaplasma sp.]|nr:homoserine kinase [Candidatus Izimaplasma bacterium]
MKTQLIRITVPATSANLGSGFDMTAVALNLYNVFDVSISNELTFDGFLKQYQTKDNLVYQSYLKTLTFTQNKDNVVPLKIIMREQNIPISSGLGSSASCIVAGVLAANHIHQLQLDIKNLFQIALQIEGHNDNVAAALYGGLVSILTTEEESGVVNHDISRDLVFEANTPTVQGNTVSLRNALPKNYQRDDVVYQLERVGILFKAFKDADIPLLKEAFKDRLHQVLRLDLLGLKPYFDDISEKTNAVFLSGSGPTIIAVYHKDTPPKKSNTKNTQNKRLYVSHGATVEVVT